MVFWCDFQGLRPGFWFFGMIFRVCGQGFGFLVRFLRFVARVWVFGCDFRGLVIDQGLEFSIHWLGFRVYAFSFVFCGREHKNHRKKMKNSEKIIQKWFFRDIPA